MALGHHIDTLTTHQITRYLKVYPLPYAYIHRQRIGARAYMCIQAFWASTLFYHLSLTTTKISILLLYIRVLTYENFRRVAWVVLGFIVILGILIVLSVLTACVPLQKFWNPSVDGVCQPFSVLWAVIGFNAGSDLLLVLLPLPVICGLTLPRRQKVGLVIVFTIGLL